jgi:hypothetical protein
MSWHNPAENWEIAAGLATGGLDGATTNSTYSEMNHLKPVISGSIMPMRSIK